MRDIVANGPLKLNIAIDACLINLKIILYHAFSLNIYEYLKYINTNNIKIKWKIVGIFV